MRYGHGGQRSSICVSDDDDDDDDDGEAISKEGNDGTRLNA